MILTTLFALALASLPINTLADGGAATYTTDPTTGAISAIRIAGDTTLMRWNMATDGSQYAWVGPKYGWGLGYLRANGVRHEWFLPSDHKPAGCDAAYRCGPLSVVVSRTKAPGGFDECYTFTNNSAERLAIDSIGIYTPYNDNYPSSEVCIAGRCHAHIWPGLNAAWVDCRRMSGRGPSLGIVATEGAIEGYDVWERTKEKGMSNYRGVIALCPRDTVLAPGASFTVAWRVFAHGGDGDFERRVVDLGGAWVSADRYVLELGDTARLTIATANGTRNEDVVVNRLGDIRVPIAYAQDRQTYARLLGVSSIARLIGRRADFIMTKQQLRDSSDSRHGAYMVYDNELQSIYKNDGPRRSSDTNEGRERLGMGVFLAEYAKLTGDRRALESLRMYARYVRHELQSANFTTYSAAQRTGKVRGYNYPWVADFYLAMYELTAERAFLADSYATMRAFFGRFGYGFYAIDMPVKRQIDALRGAGMTAEADTLLADYRLTAERFMANGLTFPRHEVNYEQSIVAPAVQFLAEMYNTTGHKPYLDAASRMMPALEAFASRQPDHHLNEVAIRHWDGYWFGKRQTFGDTFPHYWSTLTATAYHQYALATGDMEWQRRAENIVRNNLSLFGEDGSASCAFVYPRAVNGQPAHYADAFANDQDWALAFYLQICGAK